MCDSEDDEFLSASEGELSDTEETNSTSKHVEIDEKLVEDVDKISVNESTEEHVGTPNEESACHSSEDDFMRKSQSSEDSNLQIIPSSKSSIASLTEDKKILLKEVLKEAEELELSRSLSNTPEHEDQNLQCATPINEPADTESEPVPEPVIEAKAREKAPDEKDSAWAQGSKEDKVKEQSSADWGDWGDDFEATTSPDAKLKDNLCEGEWSLIDEKKLRQAQCTEEIQTQVLDKLNSTSNQGWGWGGLASALGETFSSAVENTLGLPSADEMARKTKEVDETIADEYEDENNYKTLTEQAEEKQEGNGLGLFSGILSGGIDVLENIGKKTFEAVTVKDSNQKSRRLIFTETSDGGNLSDILKERRDQDSNLISMGGVGSTTSTIRDVMHLFKQGNGQLNLETLEMLSIKLPKAPHHFEIKFLAAIKAINTDEAFNGDFANELAKIIQRIGLPYDPQGLISTDSRLSSDMDFCDSKGTDQLLSEGIEALVDFITSSVQVVSKLGQLMLLPETTVDWCLFIDFYKLLAQRISYIGDRYVEMINFYDENADSLTTELHMEISSSIDLVQQAFKLLIPIFPQ